MKTINEYLDVLKAKTGSDYASSKALGIDRSAMTQMRKRGTVADENAVKIADLLEIDESEVLLAAAIARSDGKTRLAWQNLARQAGIAASLIGVAIFSFQSVRANFGGLTATDDLTIIYIMRSVGAGLAVGAGFALVSILTAWRQKDGECHQTNTLAP